MKRGKDGETIMGPIFPRLHVNDTEKGGPRAPPRNKMALYEQLSIPSQRFSRPAMMPLNHNDSVNSIPMVSSSQRNGHGRSKNFPVQVPPSIHLVESPQSCNTDSNASVAQVEKRKILDEDDFSVPILNHSKTGQHSGDYHDNTVREKISFSSTSCYSMQPPSSSNNDSKQINVLGLNERQNANYQNEDNIEDILVSPQLDKTVDEAEGPPKQVDTSSSYEPRDGILNGFSRLQKANSRLQPQQGANSHLGHLKGHVFSSQRINIDHESFSISPRKFPLENQRNRDRVTNDTESREQQTCRSLQPNIEDTGDDISETSMVDSVPVMDISPDDVVGRIGQKHFWKARRAIVNQQRVFAIQVFELHRLIKVQRLIAESSHLLMEDNAYLGRPIKASSARRLPLDYIVKAPANILKYKNESEKPNDDKMECSAENSVEKTSLSSVKNGSQPPNNKPFVGNPPIASVTSNPNMGPWFCHPPQGHQWLIPVMSPSEGLIYKPYCVAGFTGPVFLGCGPPGSTPVNSNFLSPAYGVPAPHHHYQGIGVPTFVPPAGPHGYFPPYGMPVTNLSISGQAVENTSHFTTQNPEGQLPGGGHSLSGQQQNLCNIPTQKSGTISDVLDPNAPTDIVLQSSTASSHAERAQETRQGNTVEGNSVLPLFPTSPATNIPNGSTSHPEDQQPAQVIRVVPRDGRSASEFAARIFRSIQEERKQYDSI